MALRGKSPGWRRKVLLLPGLALALALAAAQATRAADYEGEPAPPPPPPIYDPDYGEPPAYGGKSSWEPNTSLTFYQYLDPFPRVDSARACRDRCANIRRCTGWTYYDPNFNDAGRLSYKLQRLCVLGEGVKSRQAGNRPGRVSGVLRTRQEGGGGGASGE